MPDGEVSADRLRPTAVPRGWLRAATVDKARLAAARVTGRALDGDRQRKAKTMSNTVTCTCGSAVDEQSRVPVGPVSARGAACDHGQAKGAARPTESKIGRAVETK